MQLRPLSPAIGAEVLGLDLAAGCDEAQLAALYRAWIEYGVLLLRGQRLDDAALVALTRRFGEPEIPPPSEYGTPFIAHHPEVMIISNVVEGGRALGSLGNAEALWHSDLNFLEEPPAASLLYAIEVPPDGGNTGFASMYAALDRLSPELRREVERRSIRHDASYNSAGQPRREQRPPVVHPIVRVHPESGRPCLYLGRRLGASVVGLPPAESDALLDVLWREATDPAVVWQQRWQPGDLVVWDNRCTMHRRDSFDAAARRILHRTQTRGTRPIPLNVA